MTTNVTTKVENIGPEVAKLLLSGNTQNRKLRGRYVSQLADAMERGEWEMNGQPITVSETGVLLDGQHRLSAIIESGATVPVLLVKGVKTDTFDTIDRGLKRSVGDILGISGERNVTALASALQYLHRYSLGFKDHKSRATQATAKQIKALLDDHPEIPYWVDKCADSKWMRSRVSASAAAFCFYVFSKGDLQKALDFFEALETGLMLTSDNAAYQARQRLDDIAANKNYRPERLFKLALMFKAFKAFRDDKPIKRFQVKVDEPGIFDL